MSRRRCLSEKCAATTPFELHATIRYAGRERSSQCLYRLRGMYARAMVMMASVVASACFECAMFSIRLHYSTWRDDDM